MGSLRVNLADASHLEIQAIIRRATSGDQRAATELIEALRPVLRRRLGHALALRSSRAHGRGLQPELDDLLQATFEKLFGHQGRALHSWDPERGLGFLGFVGLLAEREVGMRMRTRKRSPWTEEPMAHDAMTKLCGVTPSLAVHLETRDELHRIIERARQRLSGPGLRYFEWLLVEGRSIASVSSQTGASPGALYVWRVRLTHLLREIRTELALPVRRIGVPALHEHARSAQ